VLTFQGMARAAYSRPHIALFDDTFSGLDAETARNVWSGLFSKECGILRRYDTTVVLATQASKS
jgi:ATP-binding cassette, subfamily C (CFTR/MRP), member 1